MIHTRCRLGSGHFLPLHGAGCDVEDDGALEGEACIAWSVDGETLADAGAAVVAGEDDWVGSVGFGEQGVEGGEDGVSDVGFGVRDGERGRSTVAGELDR